MRRFKVAQCVRCRGEKKAGKQNRTVRIFLSLPSQWSIPSLGSLQSSAADVCEPLAVAEGGTYSRTRVLSTANCDEYIDASDLSALAVSETMIGAYSEQHRGVVSLLKIPVSRSR